MNQLQSIVTTLILIGYNCNSSSTIAIVKIIVLTLDEHKITLCK
jgi:hypothetical protein